MNFQATAGRCLWVVRLGRAVALLTVLAPASAVLGQGFILFNNRVPGILNAPVYNLEPSAPTTAKTGNTPAGLPAGTQTYDGPLVAGTGFTAQLFAGPLGADDEELQPLSPSASFRTGLNAGGIVAPPAPVQIPGVPVAASARLQLRVWDNQGGTLTSWPEVLASPGVWRGVSLPFNSRPLGTAISPAPLAGLTSFDLHALPAPGYPLILTPPQSQTTHPCSIAVLGVTVSGLAPLSYQWRLDDADLAGANEATLTLTNLQPANSGFYTVLVSNSAGTALSSAAALNVTTQPVLAAPQFIGGQNFQFTLLAVTGRTYVVEISTNLVNWSSLALISNPTGPTPFVHLNAPLGGALSYRARLVP